MADPTSAADRIVSGVVLAGGRARRMGGGDKGLIELNGAPMVRYVVETLRPQVATLLVNANRNQAIYAALTRCRVIGDALGDFAGPLAGMASAMQAAHTPYIATAPCDSPLLAVDLVQRLLAGLEAAGAELSVAHDGERLQPVFALLRRDLLDSAHAYLASGGRKIDQWYAQHVVAEVDFSDRVDTFLNVNTPEQRSDLERRLRNATAHTMGHRVTGSSQS